MNNLTKRVFCDFKYSINESLIIKNFIINEDKSKENKIQKITFNKRNDNFIILRQNNEHKSKTPLLKQDSEDEYKNNNNLSCDFIIIYLKSNDKLKICFAEVKSSESGFEKAKYQIKFSQLWFQYLCECYCKCYNKDNIKDWTDAIKEAKKHIIYPILNDTTLKKEIGKPKNRKPDFLKTPMKIDGMTLNINNIRELFE